MKRKIIKIAVALVLVLFAGLTILVFAVIGGFGLIKNYVAPQLSYFNINILASNKNMGDFSKLPKNYKLLNSYNVVAASVVSVEETASKQKIFVVNPGMFLNVTKQDIESNNIESQLKSMTTIGPFQLVNYDKLEIIKKGTFKINGQNVPYVKVNFSLLNKAKNSSEGIIGVIESAGNNNVFIATANQGKLKLENVEKFLKVLK